MVSSNTMRGTLTTHPSFQMHLSKSVRRTARTIRREWQLFTTKPLRRRPWTLPLLAFFAFLLFSFIVFSLIAHFWPATVFHEPSREANHFTHTVHKFVPRAADLDSVRSRRCSWLYLEFGAKDGRFVDGFFQNGNKHLEDFLRATQCYMRAFCAVVFEPDPSMLDALNAVRNERARKAAHFDIFTQVVPGILNATEAVSFINADGDLVNPIRATSISLRDFVLGTTFDWKDSGHEVPRMSGAQGNGNLGNVILRFNVKDLREAYWHLDTLEASQSAGVMCKRVDRLILNLHPLDLDESKLGDSVENRDVVREWDAIITPPSSAEYDPKNGIEGLRKIATAINERPECRTTVYVIDETKRILVPDGISDRAVHYAILAGQPTFEERVGAQTETWMTAVPQDRLTIFTNQPPDANGINSARGRNTAVVHPNRPELEKQLYMMQSWSHLVRVRESWDRTMKDNPEIKWLALVDDDTFVFPSGLREYLTGFDPRVRVWGGSGEQARIDNGDAGKFAYWLRDLHEKHGGKHCYLPHEDIPKKYRGGHDEYGISPVLNGRRVKKRVSHMCGDTFCKSGCPAVPQGAAIVISRALVEALRPHIETCEEETSHLCKNCGSQRLYMCVNRYAGHARTILTRGICRAPWKLEHREYFPFALTYHGFNRYHGMFLSTRSLRGDMNQLWELGKTYEDGMRQGSKSGYLIPMPKVADLIGCHGKGRYESGACHAPDGKQFDARDGSPRHLKAKLAEKLSSVKHKT